MNIIAELGPLLKEGIKINEKMSGHTSWQVGGPADYFVTPVDIDEVVTIVRYCRDHNLPFYPIGNGSNLLVLDAGYRGLILFVGPSFCYTKGEGNVLRAGAGTPMTLLAREAASRSLAGLEFAVGIPGSLGGAVIMNAGAFGGYIGRLVKSVTLVNYNGEIMKLTDNDLAFGYRTSSLAGSGVVMEIELVLDDGEAQKILQQMEYFLQERRKRHPSLPSAGSVFRNPPGNPAGRLVEEAGGKGMTVGGASVSTAHGNFIVNNGGASASDIVTLIEMVRKLVRNRFDIELVREVKIIGEEH